MPTAIKIPLFEVKQWLPTWDRAEWTEKLPKPNASFFLGSIKLETLRRISTVQRRDLALRKKGSDMAGIQRGHDEERSEKIKRYIDYGYPVSSQKGIEPSDYQELIHPGWIPTTIIANVLKEGDERILQGENCTVSSDHLVTVERSSNGFQLVIPLALSEHSLQEGELEPIEIIDGQHRLLALAEDENLPGEYEVPVVFFHGLTQSWQAYLFWVINVEPKRINTSLAFDLYPELRNQSWLERGEWLKIYQEHRAQELTEILWRHPESPWTNRIELHGKRVAGSVSNAAYIRSLMASFVRRGYDEDKERIGGLFGSIDREGKTYALPWKRSQQATLLIYIWQTIKRAVEESSTDWVVACAGISENDSPDEIKAKKSKVFSGPHTLIGTDQGVRGLLFIYNALLVAHYRELELDKWESDRVSDKTSDEEVTVLLGEIAELQRLKEFMKKTSNAVIEAIDWRLSTAPGFKSAEDSQHQAAYRGSSGYGLLQRNVMKNLLNSADTSIATIASETIQRLRWTEKLSEEEA
ncbi:MAG TPA: DGQHR domain-containing protein [Anaerolineales bacterium]|nr:DGQHR domain-containing protein [Anaerolineales bacterium]